MVLQQKKVALFPFRYVWFSKQPRFSFFTVFRRAKEMQNAFWIKEEIKYTKEIDLTKSLEEIQQSFSRTTRKNIRRMEKADLEISFETDKEKVVAFYNEFAKRKNLPPITVNHLLFPNEENLLITKVYSKELDELIVMHLYIVDKLESKAVQLYFPTTINGLDNSEKRNFVGRVNRYLVYKDLELLKARNYRVYDLGGYTPDTTDEAMKGINRFKDQFGGQIVKIQDYYPIWLYWLSRLRQ